jgi:methionyl-tRNA synthetase
LGNLVARVAKLCENNSIEASEGPTLFDLKMIKSLEEYKFNEALAHIWGEITVADKLINEQKPWELSGEKLQQVLLDLVAKIQHIGFNLQPFLPETADKILKQFSGQIKSSPPLFPRI